MSKIILYESDKLFTGKVLKRPSKNIKSPYVADVLVNDEEEALAHSPSLGCCGLADTDANVLMTENKNKNTKTKYKIEFTIWMRFRSSNNQ